MGSEHKQWCDQRHISLEIRDKVCICLRRSGEDRRGGNWCGRAPAYDSRKKLEATGDGAIRLRQSDRRRWEG